MSPRTRLCHTCTPRAQRALDDLAYQDRRRLKPSLGSPSYGTMTGEDAAANVLGG